MSSQTLLLKGPYPLKDAFFIIILPQLMNKFLIIHHYFAAEGKRDNVYNVYKCLENALNVL